jgi:chromate reductase
MLIINSTNRENNKSQLVANHYQSVLNSKNITNQLVSLQNIPFNFFDLNNKNEEYIKWQIDFLHHEDKLIFIVPEYNGSIPGILKMFIDSVDIKNCFYGKKAALVGLSDGRNGNLRGLDHLTGILNYVKINVLHYKVNLPSVGNIFNVDNGIENAALSATIEKQINEFVLF